MAAHVLGYCESTWRRSLTSLNLRWGSAAKSLILEISPCLHIYEMGIYWCGWVAVP